MANHVPFDPAAEWGEHAQDGVAIMLIEDAFTEAQARMGFSPERFGRILRLMADWYAESPEAERFTLVGHERGA